MKRLLILALSLMMLISCSKNNTVEGVEDRILNDGGAIIKNHGISIENRQGDEINYSTTIEGDLLQYRNLTINPELVTFYPIEKRIEIIIDKDTEIFNYCEYTVLNNNDFEITYENTNDCSEETKNLAGEILTKYNEFLTRYETTNEEILALLKAK